MFGDTPLVLVETPEALAAAVDALSRAPVIGVDTEADSFHHYQEKVCLLQVSDLDTDFVIDPLAVTDLSPLGAIMANPEQVKIFHGADYDVVSMRRDFGFTFRNLFDTMLGAQFAGLPRVGLADLIRHWFGWEIDKKYQRHDWAARPLGEEHLHYARGDTHFLPALRDVLITRLTRLGRLEPLMEECQILETRAWQGRTRDPEDFYRVKGSKQLPVEALRVLRALYAYREQEAAAMDRPVFKVIPDDVLLELARARPTSYDALANTMRKGSGIVRRHGRSLADVIATAVEDTSDVPPPPPARPKGGDGPALRGRDQERLFLALKEWRNAVVAFEGLPAVAVVSNGVLKELARVGPRTQEELEAVPELRRWQAATWGTQLLEVIADASPRRAASDEVEDAPKPRRRRRRRSGEGEAAAEAGGGAEE